jgi:endonuclease/exonuclease/phosphatase family metal-dependent hydrolase
VVIKRGGLRVLSLNLYAQHGDWPRRRTALRSGLQALQPDVVALQEAATRNGYDDACDVFGPAYEVVHQGRGLVGDGSHHGASIASRWPIRQVPRSRPAPETENR